MLNYDQEHWDRNKSRMNFFTSITIFTIGSINGAVIALLISVALR